MGKVSFQLTIADGDTVSDALRRSHLRYGRELTITSDDDFGTAGTVTVYVTDKMFPTVSDWYALQSGGADVTLSAGKALVLTDMPFMGLRIGCASDPGQDVSFGVVITDQ